MYKKLDPSDEVSYIPVSVLPLLSKVLETIIYDQLYGFLENFLSGYCVVSEEHIPHNMLFSG